ncbi:MAG TPA: glycosyltransferase 87 family protein [Pirellulales bacterium]|nr:glycosyltransferase 87 family protein [Pirellulales bacterium]
MTSLHSSGARWSWRRLRIEDWSWRAVLNPGSLERRHCLGWLAVVLAVWAWVDVRPRARIEVERPWEHQTDLTVYTEAGAAFFDGRRPYEVTNLRGWRYLYPPLLAMLLAPLHHFDPQMQALVWFAISAAFAWGCLREAEMLIERCLAPRATDAERRLLVPVIAAAVLLTATLPALNCLQRGQLGVAKLYFLLLGFRLISTARRWPKAAAGGAALAFAVAVKITPILPFLLVIGQLFVDAWRHPRFKFARGRAWSAAAGGCLGLAAFLFAVPAALVGWQTNLRHLETWRRDVLLKASDTGHDDFAGNPHSLRNQSLGNAVYRLGNWIAHEIADGPDDRRLDDFGYNPVVTAMDVPVVRQALGAVRLSIMALLLVYGVRMGGRGDRLGQSAGFGLACVATLVVSPVARGHYFMLWLPGVIAAPIWLWRHDCRRASLAVAAVPAILTLSHYLFMPTMGRIGALGLGTAIWFLATVWCMLAADRRASRGLGSFIWRASIRRNRAPGGPHRSSMPAPGLSSPAPR